MNWVHGILTVFIGMPAMAAGYVWGVAKDNFGTGVFFALRHTDVFVKRYTRDPGGASQPGNEGEAG